MPVEVIKYTCEFRCGKRATGEKGTMRAHEHKCWKNPENKTCKTCSNEIYEHDSDGYNSWVSRGCKIEALNLVLEATEDILKTQNKYHVRPVYHCPYHNLPDDGRSQSFADELKEEIGSVQEGTKHYPFYNKPDAKEKNPLPF